MLLTRSGVGRITEAPQAVSFLLTTTTLMKMDVRSLSPACSAHEFGMTSVIVIAKRKGRAFCRGPRNLYELF
jgi:hypothetical protein